MIEYLRITDEQMKVIETYMIPEKMEKIHREFAPCSHEKFVLMYISILSGYDARRFLEVLYELYCVFETEIKDAVVAQHLLKRYGILWNQLTDEEDLNKSIELTEMLENVKENINYFYHCEFDTRCVASDLDNRFRTELDADTGRVYYTWMGYRL